MDFSGRGPGLELVMATMTKQSPEGTAFTLPLYHPVVALAADAIFQQLPRDLLPMSKTITNTNHKQKNKKISNLQRNSIQAKRRRKKTTELSARDVTSVIMQQMEKIKQASCDMFLNYIDKNSDPETEKHYGSAYARGF